MVVCVQGNNSIRGYASVALIKAKEIEFNGEGKLVVTGAAGEHGIDAQTVQQYNGQNGANGMNGGNGMPGCTAMICDNGYVNGNVTIELVGGDGGNGGNGADGSYGKTEVQVMEDMALAI